MWKRLQNRKKWAGCSSVCANIINKIWMALNQWSQTENLKVCQSYKILITYMGKQLVRKGKNRGGNTSNLLVICVGCVMTQYLVCRPSLGASQKSEWQGDLWPTGVSAPPAVSEKKQHTVRWAIIGLYIIKYFYKCILEISFYISFCSIRGDGHQSCHR